MNVLFVGPYKQTDEWGRKSRSLLHAIKRTGNLVTSRPLYFAPPAWSYNEEAEYSIAKEYDAIVQFTLPSFAVYDGRFKKNIGVFNTDTIDNSSTSTSISRMKLMDEIWVESAKVQEHLSHKLQDTKVCQIGPYMDLSLEKDASLGQFPGPVLRKNEFENKFIFYFIGSLEERGGLEESMCAYLSEFTSDDNCAFMCVLDSPAPPDNVNSLVESCSARVGATRSSTARPVVHVVNPDGPLPIEARFSIHKEGDCLVNTEYSLNCSCLTLEAICAQSTPIVNKNTVAYDKWGEESLWGVDSYEESCMVSNRSFADMFTSKEICVKPTILSLAKTMRRAYTDKFLRDTKKVANAQVKQEFESDDHYTTLKETLCS